MESVEVIDIKNFNFELIECPGEIYGCNKCLAKTIGYIIAVECI